MTTALLLTASNTFIIGPIAQFFGIIMNWLFNLGVTNLGVCIILLTMIVYAAQIPLTIKTQKFSRMSAIMSPEIQAIQKKYKNKKDEASMMQMQAETKEVYTKYGVSMAGGCLPMLVQLPLLYAVYKVIYNIPAYLPSIKAIYNQYGLVDMIGSLNSDAFIAFAKTIKVSISTVSGNTIIDTLWKLQNTTWEALKDIGAGISNFSSVVDSTHAEISKYTMFLGINIADSPVSIITANWAAKNYILVFAAILLPLVSGLTQWLNIKLTPQATSNDPENQMANQMKMMNTFMPLMSVFFCFTLPSGLGIYWIAAAVFRGIQQILINQHLAKIDINALIEKNQEKVLAQREKSKAKQKLIEQQRVSERARQSTRSIDSGRSESLSDKPSPTVNTEAKPGSLADRANLVRKYDEKNKGSKNKK